MASAITQTIMTVDSYLAWEAEQTEKHDFFRGEVFAMTGGTLRHNRASLASAIAFKTHLKGQVCQVFTGDVKVAVNVAEHLFYPDVVVTCNVQDLADLDAVRISAPTLVLEVLSPSTAAYDRGQKFLSLQKLPSLQEYVLLDAQAPRLEVHRRNAAGRFELYVFEGADSEAELASIGWRGTVATLLD
ncbi:MAG: Uma2 family endonuclease [Rhodoferax sp.]|jgi:Uma2 family endonuclease|uniref:Uma2 family endonuclease n=1 Tax=Rhodoferax sp. TaxID=50421 RepID=UPI001B72C3A1|nr:Uma2 family endonuclease [Rhodoferax sp.]MBP8285371.1 Uma2 family endonuclease [Rhodoferax sp.]MBP9147921.1 Uma2 family endonuclease [Rhodoferax sp.]MBP9735018.1 Uma2 family endonuclease [Rhodoferax sp.]